MAHTRVRIARAVIEVVVADGVSALSFPAVAEQAGVSLRTVYRHFPNKERLLAAAVEAGSERTLTAFPAEERTLSGMRTFIRELWLELGESRDLLTVEQTTPAGRSLRGDRLRGRRDQFRQMVRNEVPGLADDDVDRLAALCTVLMSSHLMLDLVDELGVDRDEAAGLAAYAMESVAERARREGEVR